MAKTKAQPIQNAGEIIERFGGIRPMAAKIDTPVTTVQGWKKRDVIPATRREQILTAAQDNNIDLSDISETSTTTKPLPKATKSNIKSKPKSATKGSAAKTPQKISPSENKKPASSEKPASSNEKIAAASVVAPKISSDKSSSQATDNKLAVDEQEHDKIMKAIDQKNQKAVISSIWATVFLVLVGLALALFLLWPLLKKEVEELGNPNMVQKIEQLETKVDDVEQRTSFMGNIIPENLQQRIDGLQEQAQDIQATVANLGDISSEVLDKDAGPLSYRLEILEKKVAMLSNSENFNMLIGRVQELENSLSGQEQLKNSIAQLQEMVFGQNIDNPENLNNDLAQIRNQNQGPLGETLQGVSGNDLKAAAMLLAFSKFRDSLNREESFEEDLVLLQKLAGEDNPELQTALNRLAPKAKTGVLSPQGLSEELRSVTGDIVFSSLKGEDVSIKEKAVARLNNVFQVEKEGEPVLGTQTQLTVARAQKLLDEGNIEQAVRELRSLDGDAGLTARDFIQEAQATLMAQKTQELISDSILSKVTNIDLNQLKNNNLMNDFDLDAIKRNLDKLPAFTGGNQGVRDEASGLTILPNTQTFKGFSGGQNKPQQ